MSLDGLLDLASLAKHCKTKRNVSARDLHLHFENNFSRLGGEAEDVLYRQIGLASLTAASGDDPVEADLRAAGWKVEDHPRFIGREYVFQALKQFLHQRSDRGGVFVVSASAGMGKTALMTEMIRRWGQDRVGFYFRYRDGRV